MADLAIAREGLGHDRPRLAHRTPGRIVDDEVVMLGAIGARRTPEGTRNWSGSASTASDRSWERVLDKPVTNAQALAIAARVARLWPD